VNFILLNNQYLCSIEGCEFYCVRSDGMMNHEISVHNNDNNNQINQFAKFSKDTDILITLKSK